MESECEKRLGRPTLAGGQNAHSFAHSLAPVAFMQARIESYPPYRQREESPLGLGERSRVRLTQPPSGNEQLKSDACVRCCPSLPHPSIAACHGARNPWSDPPMTRITGELPGLAALG
jgi:hypothetical protein